MKVHTNFLYIGIYIVYKRNNFKNNYNPTAILIITKNIYTRVMPFNRRFYYFTLTSSLEDTISSFYTKNACHHFIYIYIF